MLLSKLFARIDIKNQFEDREFLSISSDTRTMKPGDVFVCIRGERFDAHEQAEEMLRRGAAAVVVERDLGLAGQILVDNTREAYTQMCAAFFDYPAERMSLIGITGTNGKTTTSFLIKGMLEALGKKTGLLGTVKYDVGDGELDAGNTTPEAFEMQSLFARMVKAGCKYCVMEVSSQALAQHRAAGLQFAAGVFTNLTQDHLDYHGTFEQYLEAKAILFRQSDLAIMNADDDAWQKLLKGTDCRLATYSKNSDNATYTAKNVRLTDAFTEYEMVSDGVIGRVHVGIPGMFTVYNSMAALVTLTELGFDFHACRKALAQVPGIQGRVEVLKTDTPYTVIIDFAHSPDALENIITTVKSIAKGRVIALFGCGGERDRTKRPLMAEIGARLADYLIITSDNPRTEDPQEIVDEVRAGVPKDSTTPVYCEVDRAKAIVHALKIAREGDIVLLAGKGHESYQVVGTEKVHFDEREVVFDYLKN